MGKKKNVGMFLAISVIVVVLGLMGWFVVGIFEGGRPVIEVKPLPEFLSGVQEFALHAADTGRGLRILEVDVIQGDRRVKVYQKKFPFKGLLNREGVRGYDAKFFLDPSALNLAQGRVDLEVRVRDFSRRGGGDGNLGLFEHKMVVDTIPPAIRAVSRMHYVNVGGTGLVVYQASSDTVESGLFVDTVFFPGFPAPESAQEGYHVCYFGLPYNIKKDADVYLWAKDKAGNLSKAGFYYHTRKKRFRDERIDLTDRFLKKILPHFASYGSDAGGDDIDKFLKINRDLRKENYAVFYNLRNNTSPRQLWDGTWLRLRNAANMAQFADHRTYYYQGKKVDEQVHLGVDLASLANSQVQAANNGRVILAGNLGIYGSTVVLDHGQGLSSVYCHLSKIEVALDQEVAKGDVIGLTGQTGLAGGDHLHFGVMVSGLFVNPIEWWDPHWVQDNITRKLALLEE